MRRSDRSGRRRRRHVAAARRFAGARSWARRVAGLFLLAACCDLVGLAQKASATGSFVAPLPPPLRVLHSFDPPSQPWQRGNRGVDLAANTGEPVFAAADAVVLYAGDLAGRGVISLNHGGLRTTYEPVDPAVRAGERVEAGQLIGRVADAIDTCGPPGSCLHWGAIRGGSYVDPMSLLGAAAPVRLLPIWPASGPGPSPGASTSGAVDSQPSVGRIAHAVRTTSVRTTSAHTNAARTNAARTNAARTSAAGAAGLALTGAALLARKRRNRPAVDS